MKKYQAYLKLPFFIVLSFLFIHIIFNFDFYKEILRNPSNVTNGQDTILVSYFAERAYQKLLQFENPFAFNDQIMYPFGSNTVLGETGIIHAFYFFIFRLFLHPYAALLLIVCVNLFFCQLAMYALLRYLKVDRFYSFLFANVFAFAPFVSVRIQYHYNYVYHFLFPLISYLILLILNSEKKSTRLFSSLFLGISVSLLFYNTLYYVFMYLLFIFLFGVFYLFYHRSRIREIREKIFGAVPYIGLSFVTTISILAPFFTELFKILQMDAVKKSPGWNGAIEFSANALDLFIPSEFNPFIGVLLKDFIPGKQQVEQIIYPGILVLIGTGLFIFANRKKWWDPLFLTGMSFYILSLGPFLHVHRFWNINITDTILGVIPLPYIILNKIPFLSMMRAPVRFAVMISFAWVIIAALGFQKHIRTIHQKVFIAIFLITVFFIDQFFIIQIKPEKWHIPLKSYTVIKNDPQAGVVMEIPYVLQDGFFYWGKVFHAYPMLGQLIHGKPVIGGYIARVHDSYFRYYMEDPFLSYFGYVADDMRQEQNVPFERASIDKMRQTSDLLQIKYILVKEDLKLFSRIEKDLSAIGYKKTIVHDDGYSLYTKKINMQTTQILQWKEKNNPAFFGGWSHPEKTHRWINGKTAGLFINKNEKSIQQLSFRAVSYATPRKVDVYINRNLHKTIDIQSVPAGYSIDLKSFVSGLNRVEFRVHDPETTPPLPSGEIRDLTIAFSDIMLQ